MRKSCSLSPPLLHSSCFLRSQISVKLSLVLVHYCEVKVGMEKGQRVKVYRLRDRVSKAIAEKLGKTGIIQDYKMTDGSGVGLVVLFDDNSSTWFFEDELKVVQ